MNLKYYLRGLGIGIVVSTLIVGIAADHRSQSLSDEEVRQRARELGMVEASGVLADEIPAAAAEKTAVKENVSAEPSPKPEEAKSETTDASKEEPKEEPKAESTKIADEMVTEESATVTITIQGGEGSYSVCKKLEEAGLVESAAAFDRYLYEKGYDKRIIAAVYAIPQGAGEDEIAEFITGKK